MLILFISDNEGEICPISSICNSNRMFTSLLLTFIHSNHHLLHFETEIFGIQNPPGTEITLMPEPVRVAGAIPDTNIFNTSSEGDGIATGKY